MKKVETVKVEGQSFDVGYIAAHATPESFVAQGVKQKLFASFGTKQEKMLKDVYALGIKHHKANQAIDEALQGVSLAAATEAEEPKPKIGKKAEEKQG